MSTRTSALLLMKWSLSGQITQFDSILMENQKKKHFTLVPTDVSTISALHRWHKTQKCIPVFKLLLVCLKNNNCRYFQINFSTYPQPPGADSAPPLNPTANSHIHKNKVYKIFFEQLDIIKWLEQSTAPITLYISETFSVH